MSESEKSIHQNIKWCNSWSFFKNQYITCLSVPTIRWKATM